MSRHWTGQVKVKFIEESSHREQGRWWMAGDAAWRGGQWSPAPDGGRQSRDGGWWRRGMRSGSAGVERRRGGGGGRRVARWSPAGSEMGGRRRLDGGGGVRTGCIVSLSSGHPTRRPPVFSLIM
ncbi:hypothetical protein DAI22_02g065700 [Oryza sativa Japonica Group]|nr:hypothetical protein DAI22_02g065700 [Oryza sativa Japonica Group]